MSKGPPIPVRFEKEETAALRALSASSGLSEAELIRRSFRLFHREAKTHGLGAMIDLTGPGLVFIDDFTSAMAAEDACASGEPAHIPRSVKYSKGAKKKKSG